MMRSISDPVRLLTLIPGGLIWLHLLPWVTSATENVNFNDYGDCSREDQPFDLQDVDSYTVSNRSPDAFKTATCIMKFRAPSGSEGICLTFLSLKITECDIKLKIYDGKTASGNVWRDFSCNDKVPNRMCTENQFVTLSLFSNPMSPKYGGYEVAIVVEQSQSMAGDEVLFTSLGVLVGIVLAVILVTALLATVLICVCIKQGRKRGFCGGTARAKKRTGQRLAQNQNLAQPSAPPEEDENELPPPYQHPPPYTETLLDQRDAELSPDTVYENVPRN